MEKLDILFDKWVKNNISTDEIQKHRVNCDLFMFVLDGLKKAFKEGYDCGYENKQKYTFEEQMQK